MLFHRLVTSSVCLTTQRSKMKRTDTDADGGENSPLKQVSERPATRRRFMTNTARVGAGAVAFSAIGAGTAAAGGSAEHSSDSGSEGIPSEFASAIELDLENEEITLPLYHGKGPDGEGVYYIIMESSDFDDAVDLGINWAPKLANALDTDAVQCATKSDTTVAFPRTATLPPSVRSFPVRKASHRKPLRPDQSAMTLTVRWLQRTMRSSTTHRRSRTRPASTISSLTSIPMRWKSPSSSWVGSTRIWRSTI